MAPLLMQRWAAAGQLAKSLPLQSSHAHHGAGAAGQRVRCAPRRHIWQGFTQRSSAVASVCAAAAAGARGSGGRGQGAGRGGVRVCVRAKKDTVGEMTPRQFLDTYVPVGIPSY
eukprot:SAG31_NODE_267_length_18790_cov_3.661655_21_plen_114_part_00